MSPCRIEALYLMLSFHRCILSDFVETISSRFPVFIEPILDNTRTFTDVSPNLHHPFPVFSPLLLFNFCSENFENFENLRISLPHHPSAAFQFLLWQKWQKWQKSFPALSVLCTLSFYRRHISLHQLIGRLFAAILSHIIRSK